MFLFVNFDYTHYYQAMDSGTQLFDTLFCCDRDVSPAFNMSVGAKRIIRRGGCCSALTQEWTGLKRPKSPDLASLWSHGENPLSLSHINSQREHDLFPPPWCLTLVVLLSSVSPRPCLWFPGGLTLTRCKIKQNVQSIKLLSHSVYSL